MSNSGREPNTDRGEHYVVLDVVCGDDGAVAVYLHESLGSLLRGAMWTARRLDIFNNTNDYFVRRNLQIFASVLLRGGMRNFSVQ